MLLPSLPPYLSIPLPFPSFLPSPSLSLSHSFPPSSFHLPLPFLPSPSLSLPSQDSQVLKVEEDKSKEEELKLMQQVWEKDQPGRANKVLAIEGILCLDPPKPTVHTTDHVHVAS